MGQAFPQNCEACFCGVVANPASHGMLPGNPSHEFSERADGQEAELPTLTSNFLDNTTAFKEPAQPKDVQKVAEEFHQNEMSRNGGFKLGKATEQEEPLKPAKVTEVEKRTPNPEEPKSKESCKGCVKRYVLAFVEQGENESTRTIRAYRSFCQLACGATVFMLSLILGAFFLAGSRPKEVMVTYGTSDTEKVFTIDQALEGDVLVYYELPDLRGTHKSFVEGKDKNAINTFMGSITCEAAETLTQARFRRGSDESFMSRIEAVTSKNLVPCGLVSLSMFADNYNFEKFNDTGWERLEADETDIALPADETAYAKITAPAEGSEQMRIGEKESWLTQGSFYEHWKVWYRTPPSPTVRNLWAVIKGGLPEGEYKVNFIENSPSWEDWGVSKRLLFTEKSSFGSAGAMEALGGFCIALMAVEVFALLAALVLWAKTKKH